MSLKHGNLLLTGFHFKELAACKVGMTACAKPGDTPVLVGGCQSTEHLNKKLYSFGISLFKTFYDLLANIPFNNLQNFPHIALRLKDIKVCSAFSSEQLFVVDLIFLQSLIRHSVLCLTP